MKKTAFYYQTVLAVLPVVIQLFAKELKAAYVAEEAAKEEDEGPGDKRFELENRVGETAAYLALNLVDQAQKAGKDFDHDLKE